MPERPPGGGFVQRLQQRPVEDVDRALQEMLPPLQLRRERLVWMRRQPRDHGRLDRLPAQVVQRGLVDDVVLATTPQQRQEVQARFRPAGAEDAKAFAANLRGDTRTAGMPCAGIIDGDVRRGVQARLQDRAVFLLERLQIRREQAHHLALGDRQADAVEQIGQALGGHLALRVQGEAEPAHAGTEPAGDPDRQGRDEGLALGCHPAFSPVAHNLGDQHQIPAHHRLVAFEARAGWDLGPERHLAGDPIPFGATAWTPARTRGSRLGGFLHPGGFEGRPRRQVLEPGDLVLQGLVVEAQVAVGESQLLDLVLQSTDLAGQIRDQLAQGLLGQRLGDVRRRHRHA